MQSAAPATQQSGRPVWGISSVGRASALLDRLQACLSMIDTKLKGNLTELQCLAAFTEIGATVSIPFGEDSRYDFIADIHGKLLRIQCKTCHEVTEENTVVAIGFKTVRQSGNCANHWTRTPYTKEEIDYFATYYNGKCYLVPVEECSNEKRLRFVAPKNGQVRGINFADYFEIKGVIDRL